MLVTAVVYREPGLLAKTVTTLDVLSGGRAWLGIGAAWNEEESRGLGLPFPPTAERFERLEETLQICQQMWSDDDGPFEGEHYQLGAHAQLAAVSLSGPHPSDHDRRLAASARRCAWSPGTPTPATSSTGPRLAHKLDVLREHCEREGRDYDEIEKTTILSVEP